MQPGSFEEPPQTTALPPEGLSAGWPEGVWEWLDAFSRAVREVDFERGRALFLPDAQGFGTRASAAASLDDLVTSQWSSIWPRTEGFYFVMGDRNVVNHCLSATGDLCTLWVRWRSRARADEASTTGAGFARCGRCTIVLVRDTATGSWKAAHSHFSVDPPEDSWERRPALTDPFAFG